MTASCTTINRLFLLSPNYRKQSLFRAPVLGLPYKEIFVSDAEILSLVEREFCRPQWAEFNLLKFKPKLPKQTARRNALV